jgi:hypothetical protein
MTSRGEAIERDLKRWGIGTVEEVAVTPNRLAYPPCEASNGVAITYK